MKRDEVTIGGFYAAKVSDKRVPVRIDGTHTGGGWIATNTATGKRFHIKSAQCLRRAVQHSAADANTAQVGEVDRDRSIDPNAPARRKRAKRAPAAKAPKSARDGKPARVSALDAAATVLRKARKPMRCTELIAVMAKQGLWSSPNGRTPQATLYAAMLREMRQKKSQARFKKIDRGQFEFNG